MVATIMTLNARLWSVFYCNSVCPSVCHTSVLFTDGQTSRITHSSSVIQHTSLYLWLLGVTGFSTGSSQCVEKQDKMTKSRNHHLKLQCKQHRTRHLPSFSCRRVSDSMASTARRQTSSAVRASPATAATLRAHICTADDSKTDSPPPTYKQSTTMNIWCNTISIIICIILKILLLFIIIFSPTNTKPQA